MLTENTKSLLILDADGTIWDSEPDIIASLNAVFRTHVGREMTIEQFKELTGQPMIETIKGFLLPDELSKADQLLKLFRSYYNSDGHFKDQTLLYPLVHETLDTVKARGVRLAILSTKPQDVLSGLVDHFQLSQFDQVVGTDGTAIPSKPDPAGIHLLLEYFGAEAREAAMVGDHANDIKAGENAGVDTVAALYGFTGEQGFEGLEPTLRISSFSGLTDAFRYPDEK